MRAAATGAAKGQRPGRAGHLTTQFESVFTRVCLKEPPHPPLSSSSTPATAAPPQFAMPQHLIAGNQTRLMIIIKTCHLCFVR